MPVDMLTSVGRETIGEIKTPWHSQQLLKSC